MRRREFVKCLALVFGSTPVPGPAAAVVGAIGRHAALLPTLIGIGATGHRVIVALARIPTLPFGKCLLVEPRDGRRGPSEPAAPWPASVLEFPEGSGEVTLDEYVGYFEHLVPLFVDRGDAVVIIGHASEFVGFELTYPIARAARAIGAEVETVLLRRRSR